MIFTTDNQFASGRVGHVPDRSSVVVFFHNTKTEMFYLNLQRFPCFYSSNTFPNKINSP